MSQENEWNVISTERIRKGRFEIVYEIVQFASGVHAPFSYVRYQADGVCILPVLPDGSLCLVKQYRRPVDASELEVPAGMIECNEKPIDAAKRELEEETGLTAKNILDCGFLYTSPGSSTERMYLYIALCDADWKAQRLDASEQVEVQEYSVEQVQHMIAEGKIHHSATQVLFYRYLANREELR